jgi:hypothetical protein
MESGDLSHSTSEVRSHLLFEMLFFGRGIPPKTLNCVQTAINRSSTRNRSPSDGLIDLKAGVLKVVDFEN